MCIAIYVYQTTLVQHYILVDKQPAKRFVEDTDCNKIYGAIAALMSATIQIKSKYVYI